MMTDELKKRLLTFWEKCESYYGQSLQINETISTNKQNFDRHFVTTTFTEFVFTRFGIRFGGARAIFEGEKFHYEIRADAIVSFCEQKDEVEFIEIYSDTVYRKTNIKIA